MTISRESPNPTERTSIMRPHKGILTIYATEQRVIANENHNADPNPNSSGIAKIKVKTPVNNVSGPKLDLRAISPKISGTKIQGNTTRTKFEICFLRVVKRITTSSVS